MAPAIVTHDTRMTHDADRTLRILDGVRHAAGGEVPGDRADGATATVRP